MQRLRLYIDGRLADIADDNLVVMTYQTTDAEKPAAVKNSYSQGVTLPATGRNDEIFSHVTRTDYRWTAGRFNPLARTPFEIRNERNEVLVKGYLRLDDGVPGKEYSVTLYGGLGGFFYGLMYDDEGEKKTLGDLRWMDDIERWLDKDDTIGVSAVSIRAMWNDEDIPPRDGYFYNFAPCYNGIPEDFDADKAYYVKGSGQGNRPDLYDTVTDGGKTYGPKNGAGKGILVEMGAAVNEWEIQDLRNYLQRPVWSVYEFFRSICNKTYNGGYDVELDAAFFNASNPYYRDAWCTLPLMQRDKINALGQITLGDFFAGTDSPADYLLSYAKRFGLIFDYDEAAQKVRILTRNTYYSERASEAIDLRPIVAEDKGVTVSPLLMSARWEIVQSEVVGANAEKYEAAYGKRYGSIWVNTGYPFGAEQEDVFKDDVFRASPDTLENGLGYRVLVATTDPEYGDATGYGVKQRMTGEVKWQLYTGTGDNQTSRECVPEMPLYDWGLSYNGDYPYYDFLPKVQLYDADGGPTDGQNILLFYGGKMEPPHGEEHPTWEAQFFLTNDNSDMLDINGGKPCWDLSGTQTGGRLVSVFPVFRRNIEKGGEWWSMEWSEPKEVYVPGDDFTDREVVYRLFWENLFADRFDVDGRKMRCWVNFHTPATPLVDARLLRRFFYYGGAYWVLNRISAHALAREELTECEFVKVQDIRHYTQGQYDFSE